MAAAVDLPLLLYNNPARTQVNLTTDTVVRLAQVANIVGIKDSSGNLGLTADYIDNTPDDFAVLAGNDAMIYAILCTPPASAALLTPSRFFRYNTGI